MHTLEKLPPHLSDNVQLKFLVYRHPNLNQGRSVPFSYTRGRDYDSVRQKAIAYALKMDKKLGPPPATSPEGRMTVRNSSGYVGVDPKKHRIVKKSGREYIYYYWRADWVGCPKAGGISWSRLSEGDDEAYILAVLSREFKCVNKNEVRNKLARLSKSKYEKILSNMPDND